MGLYKAGATKIRPIIVTLQNQKTKFQILKNSQKMKDCTTHTKLGFRMNLTKKQLKEDKALRVELEERKKTEDVMIYKSKIILRSIRQPIWQNKLRKITLKTRKGVQPLIKPDYMI